MREFDTYRFLLFFVLYIGSGTHVTAQPDTLQNQKLTYKTLFSLGLGVQHGFVFAHSAAVENTKGARPTGIEAILGWQRTDSSVFALCNCYPRKGLLLAYYDYDNAILGKSVTAAYFLEPTYRLGKHSFFSFRGAAGFSYLTNPFDSLRNPHNRSYSTRISGYLLVGIGAWFRLSDHWWLNPSINYQHISNGGLREPNKGINWPTAGLAVSYQPKSSGYFTGKRSKEKFWIKLPVRWDAAVFGMARNGEDLQGNRGHFLLIGVQLQAAKQVGRINNLTLGAEVYRDEDLYLSLKRDSLQASPVKAGVLAGHEFILGRFLFSQQLGVYIFDQTPYFDQLYHRWGVQYNFSQHFGVGFKLKAHRHVAEFIDLRVVYSFRHKP
jgi:hypothetical protein